MEALDEVGGRTAVADGSAMLGLAVATAGGVLDGAAVPDDSEGAGGEECKGREAWSCVVYTGGSLSEPVLLKCALG